MNTVPMTPNPGGVVDPSELVGRADELQRLHEAVSRGGGAQVLGERRMGKTSLLRKLADEMSGQATVVSVSAETNSLETLADRMLGQLRRHRRIDERIARWEIEVKGTAGLMIGAQGIKLQARGKRGPSTAEGEVDVLQLLSDLGSAVLIVDEVTSLCHQLGRASGSEFLRRLRAARQGGLPMVLSGSIGLHHAIDDMSVVNDLWQVDLRPLPGADAEELTMRLLLGIGHESPRDVLGAIVGQSSGVPYYIQAIVDQSRYRPGDSIDAVVACCLTQNLWDTEHYVTRIPDYYGTEHAELVRAILDQVALSAAPLGVEELSARLGAADPDLRPSRTLLLDLVGKLEKDYYLIREGDRDRMASPLLARVWRHHRRLG